MRLPAHLKLLGSAIATWLGFWLAGLPDYYQQYSATSLGVGCTLLSVAISLVALLVLGKSHCRARTSLAFWIAFYFTLPLALLDYLYCGVFLGQGFGFVTRYWYLSLFYITPWLTFPPTAWLLNRGERS